MKLILAEVVAREDAEDRFQRREKRFKRREKREEFEEES